MAPVAQVCSTNSGSPSTSRQANGTNTTANNNSNNHSDSSGSSSKNSFVQKYLNNCKSFYSCIHCRTHLANHDELVSRSFQGNRSRAYLFNSVINISCGPAVQRELNTGSHAVADIFCTNCGTTMGWKYEKAYVETQKYKEGKYIIELAHVVRENRHLEFDKRDEMLFSGNQNSRYTPTAMTSTTSNAGNSNHCGSLSSNHWSSSSPSSSSNYEEVVSMMRVANGGDRRYYHDHHNDDDDDDNDDDELLFPFYDDLCSPDRSSYPGFSSSRLRDSKIRRSLYLDSTPYDWKYSTSTSDAASSPVSPPSPLSSSAAADQLRVACNGNDVEAATMGSWLCYSDSVQSTSSSSSTSSPGEPGTSSSRTSQLVELDSSNKQNSDSGNKTNADDATNSVGASANRKSQVHSENREDDETQFDLESDSVSYPDESSSAQQEVQKALSASTSASRDEAEHSCDQSALVGSNSTASTSARVNDLESGSLSQAGTASSSSKDNIQKSLSQRLTSANSLSLDDEEFYDCCADHEVINSSASSTRNTSSIPQRNNQARKHQ